MPKLKFQRKAALIITLIILLLVFSSYTGLGRFTTGYLTFATNPVIRIANYISTSLADFIALYATRLDLNQANDHLRQQLIELAKTNIELKLLKQENDLLKQELAFLDDYQYSYVLARVLGQSLDYASSYILIDKGSADGLKTGLAVTAAQGVLIGKIIQVEDHLSYVRFLTDNSSQLAALVMAENPSPGIVHGQRNINLKIDMLPKDIPISPGDFVATSGLEADIPAGLIIGSISQVDNIQERFWQEAIIQPAIDYASLQLVTVILPAVN